ncbi:succinate dehydrogenase, hydrophobic membrane anchor protein [Rhodobacteraceae bacterium NNCM2]|nr:succinate dehydrogenase, hydrophobic membrane anchor protein [Coraliihabitans acroporae]
MSFKTPRQYATGLGSGKSGTHHWWSMRISSVALIPLSILFVLPFADALGGGYEEVIETYTNPFNAIVAALFLAVGFHHLMQGMQTVIEDYVHAPAWRTALLLGNSMLCGALGFAGIFAVLKIAFTA